MEHESDTPCIMNVRKREESEREKIVNLWCAEESRPSKKFNRLFWKKKIFDRNKRNILQWLDNLMCTFIEWNKECTKTTKLFLQPWKIKGTNVKCGFEIIMKIYSMHHYYKNETEMLNFTVCISIITTELKLKYENNFLNLQVWSIFFVLYMHYHYSFS